MLTRAASRPDQTACGRGAAAGVVETASLRRLGGGGGVDMAAAAGFAGRVDFAAVGAGGADGRADTG